MSQWTGSGFQGLHVHSPKLGSDMTRVAEDWVLEGDCRIGDLLLVRVEEANDSFSVLFILFVLGCLHIQVLYI